MNEIQCKIPESLLTTKINSSSSTSTNSSSSSINSNSSSSSSSGSGISGSIEYGIEKDHEDKPQLMAKDSIEKSLSEDIEMKLQALRGQSKTFEYFEQVLHEMEVEQKNFLLELAEMKSILDKCFTKTEPTANDPTNDNDNGNGDNLLKAKESKEFIGEVKKLVHDCIWSSSSQNDFELTLDCSQGNVEEQDYKALITNDLQVFDGLLQQQEQRLEESSADDDFDEELRSDRLSQSGDDSEDSEFYSSEMSQDSDTETDYSDAVDWEQNIRYDSTKRFCKLM